MKNDERRLFNGLFLEFLESFMVRSLYRYHSSLSYRRRSSCSSSSCCNLCQVKPSSSHSDLQSFLFRFVDRSSFLPCQWPIHSLFKWVNSSCQWIYTVHQSSHQLNNPMKESFDETISCLSTMIFDRLAQASTRIQIVRSR